MINFIVNHHNDHCLVAISDQIIVASTSSVVQLHHVSNSSPVSVLVHWENLKLKA